MLSLPERDQLSVSYTKYKSKVAMAMGGKVAEELIFGAENVTSGATSDIQQVSRIARAMVTQFGFSEALGNVDYANERVSYLGTSQGGTSHSGTTQKLIDDEVKTVSYTHLDVYKRQFNGSTGTSASRTVPYSEFIQRVDQGDVQSVTLDGEKIVAKAKDGSSFGTIAPSDSTLTDRLLNKGVEVRAESQQQSGIMSLIGVYLPFIILIGVWIFFMNRMQGGGKGGAMGFGKSRAKLLTEKSGRVTFDDVAGIDEAKDELEEIVEFLRNPQKFSRLGGKIPKGALLVLSLIHI